MQGINRFVGSTVLAAAAFAATAMVTEGQPQEARVQVRVYDRDHRDYHNWDDREDRAYRHYLEGRHEMYREYHKQHYRAQKHYWRWRHEHPDHD